MKGKLETVLRSVTLRELGPSPARALPAATTLQEAYEALDEEASGAVVVTDGERPVGIFTARDVLYRTALEKLDPATPIRDLMTPEPRALSLEQPVAEAVREMTEQGVRHLPVTDESGRLRGMVSSRDVLRFIAGFYPESVLNLPPRLRQQMPTAEGG